MHKPLRGIFNMLVANNQVKWSDHNRYEEGESATPQKLMMDSSSIYSAGITMNTTTQEGRYVVIRYDRYERILTEVQDTTNGTCYVDNELIVGFAPNAVDTSFVNNRDRLHGLGSEVLKPQALIDLQEMTGMDFSRFNFLKIHKNLTTDDTLSLSRMNEWVKIPPFWADFIVVPPQGYGNTASLQTHLDSTGRHLIAYANLNFLGELHCGEDESVSLISSSTPGPGAILPNDLDPNPNSTDYGSLYYGSNQHASGDWEFGKGNICALGAWQFEVGKPTVKCGIFDSGIYKDHPDFNGQNGSVVKEVYDVVNNFSLTNASPALQDQDSHGSLSAGIIGAVRNNYIGRPGIAGGDSLAGQDGVSMYGLKVTEIDPNTGLSTFITIDHLSEALVESSIDDPGFNPVSEFKYGLNIGNISLGFLSSDLQYFSGDFFELMRAVQFAVKNKVTLVASRGNHTDNLSITNPALQEPFYPACFNDHLMMNVSGLNIDGSFVDIKFQNSVCPSSFISYWNQGVDISAPSNRLGGCGNIGTVPSNYDPDPNNLYDTYGGTSAAATHVTGTGALLMSYLNDVQPNYINLAPEDVERLIERGGQSVTTGSAGTPLPGNPELFVGSGALNARNSLQEVNKSYRDLLHYSTSSFTSSGQSAQQQISLEWPIVLPNSTVIPAGDYLVVIEEFEFTGIHSLGANEVIVDAWSRHSSSTLFNGLTVNNELFPYEFADLINYDETSATLISYGYTLYELNGTPISKIPEAYDIGPSEYRAEYTLLVEDTLTASVEELAQTEFNLYPNPANDQLTLEWSGAEVEMIEIYDISGKVVHTVSQLNPSVNYTQISLDTCEKGVYLVRFLNKNKEKLSTQKFVKL